MYVKNMDKKPTALICGCAKNCGQYIDGVFKNIKQLQEIFDIPMIYISYDKSSDDTLNKLTQKQSDYNLTILEGDKPLLNCVTDGILRVVNICNARNRYMEKIINMETTAEYFIVMDMDDVCSDEINIQPIRNVMSDASEWDGVTFDNIRYYDFWALSIRPFTVSCFMSADVIKTMRLMLLNLRNKRDNPGKYIDCESAFNGFGIYKSSFYRNYYNPFHSKGLHITADLLECMKSYNIKYPSFLQNKLLDCEHRAFHINAKKLTGARLKISKEQIFKDYDGEHARWLYNSNSSLRDPLSS